MAHRLYMDVHVPLAITERLSRRGIDVLTSQSDGTDRLDDELLLQRATILGRILFSQDEDLLAIGEIIDDLELFCVCADLAVKLTTDGRTSHGLFLGFLPRAGPTCPRRHM